MLQGTASETVLIALLAAQAKAMAGRPAEQRERLVCYSSDQVKEAICISPMQWLTVFRIVM